MSEWNVENHQIHKLSREKPQELSDITKEPETEKLKSQELMWNC